MRILSMVLIFSTLLPLQAQAFSDQERKDIESIVQQYLMDNPGVIFEATNKYQEDQARQMFEATERAIKENHDELFKNKNHYFIGSKNARVSMVEFFDYNCPYCKHAYPEVVKAVEKNKDIRMIFIDIPVLGPSSLLAAQWSLAAGMMGKYNEFHGALMEFQGPKTEETLTKLAQDVGLDVAKLKEKAASDEVSQQLEANETLYRKLGLSGVPAFLTPDRLIRGQVTPEALDAIAKDYLAKNPTVKK